MRRALALFGLSAFAFAQPLFDFLRQHPQFLVAHRAAWGELLSLVILLLLPIPLVLMGVEAGLHRVSPAVARRVHHGLVTALVATIAVPPLLRTTPASRHLPALGLALLLGIGFALAGQRNRLVRIILATSALAGPIFAALFLLLPPVRGLWSANPAPQEAAGTRLPIPVVMILYDALPLSSLVTLEGSLDEERYPNFAALAEDSIWFDNATTSADMTLLAVPSIVTGRRPSTSTATVEQHPQNLFTLLASSHDLIVSETTTQLCPAQLNQLRDPANDANLGQMIADLSLVFRHMVTPDPLRRRLPPIDRGWRNLTGVTTIADGNARSQHHARQRAWLDLVTAPRKRPGFSFLHLLLPHRPYVLLPGGIRYSELGIQWGGRETKPNERVRDEWATLQSFQRHLLQLRHTDEMLGEILEELKRREIYDNAILIVTADHGVNFDPGGSPRDVRGANAPDILRIPLFVKLPGQERGGERDPRNVETIDLAPTILALLRTQASWEMEGGSMLDSSVPERPEKVVLTRWRNPVARRYPARSLSFTRTVERRWLHLEGDGPDAIYALGDDLGLVGRHVDDFAVGRVDEPRWRLHEPERFANVEPSSGTIPAEITGTIEGVGIAETVQLAVAVNGRIEAVTHPTRNWSGSRVAPWSALVRPASLRPGPNRVEVLLVVRDEPGAPQLARCAHEPTRTSYLDVRLGGRSVLGVAEEGFGHPSGELYRWTRSSATLQVPTPDPPPSEIEVQLLSGGDHGSRLTLRVNGTDVLSEHIPRGSFRRSVPLEGVRLGDELRIELLGVRFDSEGEPAQDSPEQVLPIQGIWLRP